jgi:hypothetical protein
MALVGLLVIAAISVAAGSGRIPAKEEQSTATIRRISTCEAMDILRKFPELIPDFLAKRKDDAEYMAGTFRFVEVTIAPLARLFPTARFYRGHDFYSPPHPYLMAIQGNKRYPMPYGFNHLLIDNGLKVTDKNIIALAKAFVTVAIGEGLPKVTFLQATRTKQVISGRSYSVRLEVRTDEQIEEWFFSLSYWHDQFGTVYRRGPHGYIDSYDPPTAEPSPGRGRLNLGTPSMAIDAIRMAAAQAERDSLRTGLASGSEPEEGQEVKVSLRRLSASEVMGILHKFPEMVASYLAYLKGSEALASVYPLSEVTAAPLKRALPNVRIFKGLDFGIHPPIPYVMATAGRKRYPMPCGLNQLLVDSDVRVTDANLVEIAKAAVILALGADMVGSPRNTGYVSDELLAFPKITSLSAEMQVTGESHAAKLTVRIGDSEESWYVPRWHDQLGWVSRGNANGLINDYQIPEAQPLRQR